MIIRELELKNFRCFENHKFEFPQGVIGILGPNGSGKSTVLEAISWCLYGSSVLRTNREDLRLDSAGESETCKVKLKFQLEGEAYELERKMTGKSLSSSAYIASSETTLAESFQGVTDYVETELLHMREKSFFRSVFSRQNEVRELSNAGPEERRQLFSRLLDIDRIKQARRDIDGTARDNEQRADTLESQLENLDELETELEEKSSQSEKIADRVASLEERLSKVNEKIDARDREFEELEEKRENLTKLKNSRARLETTISGLKDNIGERKEELKALVEKKKQADNLEEVARRYEKLKTLKSDLEEKREKYHEKQQLKSDLKTVEESLSKEKEKLETHKGNLEKFGNLSEKINTVKEKKTTVESKTRDLEKKIAEKDSSISSHQETIEELEGKMEDVRDLGEEGECPVCTRELGDDYETVIGHFREEIEKAEAKVRTLKADQQELNDSLSKAEGKIGKLTDELQELEEKNRKKLGLESKVEDLESRVTELDDRRERLKDKLDEFGEVDFDPNVYQETKKELANIEEENERYRSLRQESERIPEVRDKLEGFEEQLEQKKTKLKELTHDIADFDFDKKRFEEVKQELKELRAEKEKIQEEFTRESRNQTKLETEIDHLKKEIEQEREKRKKLEDIRKEIRLYERVSGFFDQFRLDLLNRIRPVLSRRASKLLERTTDGRYRKLNIDEDYRVRVFEDGTPYPLDRFSGGETDLANLCLRVAISELVAKRSGRQINFIVLDEIFGSQDLQRRANILQALRNLDDLFVQIFLITHSEEVKDRMENVILLSREHHGTTTVQELF